jgi:hypothetical protein
MTIWKTQISKIRNEKGKVTTNTKEIQEIIRDYFENLYSNKLENLEEMDKFLSNDHPKLIQEDTDYFNWSVTHNEIEAAIESPKKPKKYKTQQIFHWILPDLKRKININTP